MYVSYDMVKQINTGQEGKMQCCIDNALSAKSFTHMSIEVTDLICFGTI